MLESDHTSCPIRQSAAMASILVILSLVALAQAGVPMQREIAGRVVNGRDAKMGEIPYQVSIQNYRSFHMCGGSIVNAYYVVTAVHCVEKQSVRLTKVIAGSINLEDPKSTHRVAKFIVHEKYNGSVSWTNDIALIKVRDAFEVSETIGYVTLPKLHEKVPVNSKAIVSGWGRAELRNIFPDELKIGEIVIADQDYCREIYAAVDSSDWKPEVYDTDICAYDPENAGGACEGDSGGPLIVDGKLVGITAWEQSCGSTEYPVVFGRVAEHVDWIKAHAV